MYGCNNFCTYCIVPYVRGRERSRLPEDIVREVEQAVKAGYKEVTLLGQNVNSYGKDHKQADFAELLAMVDKVEGIERVRFMTSHPKDLSDKVIETMAQGKHLCEHIHLPVQHGSSKILKAMNRVYTAEAYKDLVKRIRAAIPEVSLTTDLIVGFPGETEEDFEELLAFLKEIRYDAAYTFIYSKRSGTPAAEMAEQVPEDVKKARLQKLMEVQNEISLEINKSLQGKTMEVMVEGPSKNDETVWMGHTRSNKIVLFPHGQEKEGDFVQVKITSPQTWVLKGEVC
jgi:tRNA-2-methylthio-N6-dimethylallyladenosine synthase